MSDQKTRDPSKGSVGCNVRKTFAEIQRSCCGNRACRAEVGGRPVMVRKGNLSFDCKMHRVRGGGGIFV